MYNGGVQIKKINENIEKVKKRIIVISNDCGSYLVIKYEVHDPEPKLYFILLKVHCIFNYICSGAQFIMELYEIHFQTTHDYGNTVHLYAVEVWEISVFCSKKIGIAPVTRSNHKFCQFLNSTLLTVNNDR